MIKFEIGDTSALTDQLKQELADFAQRCVDVKGEYIRNRFTIYDGILVARKDQAVIAFQFFHLFEQAKGLYVYLGPLFSMQNGYVQMFFCFYEYLQNKRPNQIIHLMAEIENPDVLLVFKTLFLHNSYPRLNQTEIPESVKQIVATYCEQIEHIQGVNLDNLTTRSSTSLYREGFNTEQDPVMAWLEARDVRFSLGESQLLVTTVPASIRERRRYHLLLLQGRLKLKHWDMHKNSMLDLFREGTKNGA
jgi:hypothetical protein